MAPAPSQQLQGLRAHLQSCMTGPGLRKIVERAAKEHLAVGTRSASTDRPIWRTSTRDRATFASIGRRSTSVGHTVGVYQADAELVSFWIGHDS
jgi:hypothetical protein